MPLFSNSTGPVAVSFWDTGQLPERPIVIARYGEDPLLVSAAFSREQPMAIDVPIVGFRASIDLAPRVELCSIESVAAVLPAVKAMIARLDKGHAETVCNMWREVCRQVGVTFEGAPDNTGRKQK